MQPACQNQYVNTQPCPNQNPITNTDYNIVQSCSGAPCEDTCVSGYIYSNGTCIVSCPSPSIYYNGICCTPQSSCTANGYCGINSDTCGGACACPSGQVCFGGICTCPSGQIWYNGSCCLQQINCPSNGYCGIDSDTCGSVCSCPSGQTCQGNTCTCPAGEYWDGAECASLNCSSILPPNSTACNGTNPPTENNEPYVLEASCGTNPCSATCNSGYTLNNGSCQENDCGPLPANADSCPGTSSPLTNGQAYQWASPCGSDPCTAQCTSGYVLSGSSCVQTSCGALPSHSVACPNTEPATIQSQPFTLTGSCTNVTTPCTAQCASGYSYDGISSCLPYTCANLPANSNANACTGTNPPATQGQAYKLVNFCGTTACSAQCNTGYNLNGAGICVADTCANPPPANSIICAGTNPPTINNQSYVLENSCSTDPCSAQCKSGYTLIGQSCIPNSCGNVPNNTTPCAGTNSPTQPNQTYNVVVSCSTNPCTATCNSGYTLNNGSCGANNCGGTLPINSSACNNTNPPSTPGQPYALVASCSSTACTAQCNTGYAFNGSSCPPDICANLPGSSNATACTNTNPPTTQNQSYTFVSACGSAPCTAICKSNASLVSGSCQLNSCASLAANSNATLCPGTNPPTQPNQSTTLMSSCGITACSAACNNGYTLVNGFCIANTCGTLPINATDCGGGIPSSTDVPYTLISTCSSPAVSCTAKCATGYWLFGGKCRQNGCGSLPANATVCPNTNPPATRGTSYSLVTGPDKCGTSSCTAYCSSGYSNVNGTCEQNSCGPLPAGATACGTSPDNPPTSPNQPYVFWGDGSGCGVEPQMVPACTAYCDSNGYTLSADKTQCVAHTCGSLPPNTVACPSPYPAFGQGMSYTTLPYGCGSAPIASSSSEPYNFCYSVCAPGYYNPVDTYNDIISRTCVANVCSAPTNSMLCPNPPTAPVNPVATLVATCSSSTPSVCTAQCYSGFIISPDGSSCIPPWQLCQNLPPNSVRCINNPSASSYTNYTLVASCNPPGICQAKCQTYYVYDSGSNSCLPNATCGSANGTATLNAPSSNLCYQGTPSSVAAGPLGTDWEWSCVTTNNTVQCSAPLTTIPGCGSANGSTPASIPTTNLCATGTPSTVSGSGPWTWSCTGSVGTTPASCSTIIACGSANGVATYSQPSSNLCAGGTASTVNGPSPWTWSCTQTGFSAVSCSAPTAVLGVCGSANGQSLSSPPTSNFCSVGSMQFITPGSATEPVTSFSNAGPWSWKCVGTNGGNISLAYAVICEAHQSCAAGQKVTAPPYVFYSATFPAAPNGKSLSEPRCDTFCCDSGCGYINATCGDGNWQTPGICWVGGGGTCPPYPSS